jgi:hypothetical protein
LVSLLSASLHKYLQTAEDKAVAVQKFVMQGKFELKDQIDSSHDFLYGHRFWKEVKMRSQTAPNLLTMKMGFV